jgi:hypothetical protein
MCAISAFVCFSGEKMPGATNSRPQKPMPSPTCCYCGVRQISPRKHRAASAEQQHNAALWRKAAGKQPLLFAKHVCTTHNAHDPASAAAAEVRSKMYKQHCMRQHSTQCSPHIPLLHCLYILLLCVYSRVQQLQQRLHDARSATSPTSPHCAFPHLHAALRALPASVRSTRDSRRWSDTLSLC